MTTPKPLRPFPLPFVLLLLSTVAGACSKATPSSKASAHRTPPFPNASTPALAGLSPKGRKPDAKPVQARAPGAAPPGVFIEPDGPPEKARPLLVFLHGLGGSGLGSVQALGLSRLAREKRTYVYAPDGERDSTGRRFWNAHPACCNFENKPVDDVSKLKRAIELLEERPGIDDRRLYVLGHSNGGFMALRLACEMGDQLAAVASVAGAGPMRGSSCQIKPPLHVLAIHGDNDRIVGYDGGTVFGDPDRPKHESARDTLKGWSQWLGCTGAPKRGAPLDLDVARPGAETRVEAHEDCTLGGAELWTVAGGTHSIISSPNLIERVWDFFMAHPKN